MNIFFYTILFIMGITFGSFYTLAVYRIPKGQDITHTHSYCPNCGYKLKFLDLIPVLSYIFLGGKCRSCKKPIRKRYIILEISSGLLFVLLGYAIGLNVYSLTMNQIISFSFMVLYLSGILLIMGTDLENRKIEKSLLAYMVIISLIYIIYLYIIDVASIYRYAIYLIVLVMLLLIDNIQLRKKAENNYLINVLLLILNMLIFTKVYVTLISCIVAVVAILIYTLIHKSKNKNIKSENKILSSIKLGYVIGLSNIIVLFVDLILEKIIH